MDKAMDLAQEKADSLKKLTMIVYILQAVGCIIGLTPIFGVIINHLKAGDVKGTWLESHFRWQIRTFWFSLLWSFVGFFTYLFIIGILVLIATFIWYVYRVVKGYLAFKDGKEMYV